MVKRIRHFPGRGNMSSSPSEDTVGEESLQFRSLKRKVLANIPASDEFTQKTTK